MTSDTNPEPSTTAVIPSETPAPNTTTTTAALSSQPEKVETKNEDESTSSSKGECCGVPKKRCAVVWTVFGLISILFLTCLIVFCYYFFEPGPRRLECACDSIQADGCKALKYGNRIGSKYDKIYPIYGTAKCQPGEECYIRQKEGEQEPRMLCRKNPGNYKCKRGQKTTECWCDKSLCFDKKVLYTFCNKSCTGVGKGQVKKKPGY